MRRAITAALLPVAMGWAGCGGASGAGPDAGVLAREAALVVERLERSLAGGDYELVCDELLSADVRRQAGGGDCPGMLERTSGGLTRPRIEVKKIQIRESVAVLDVVTSAQGQSRVGDTVRLVREAGAWRISSLSG